MHDIHSIAAIFLVMWFWPVPKDHQVSKAWYTVWTGTHVYG